MEAREKGERPAGWWANRSIHTKGLVVLAVPIAILLGVLAATSWFTHLNDAAQATGTQARQGISDLDELTSTVLNADNGVGDYLVTRSTVSLTEYRTAAGTAPSLLARISSLATMTEHETEAYPAVSSDTHRMLVDLSRLSAQTPGVWSPRTVSLVVATETESGQFRLAVSRLDSAFNSSASTQHNSIHDSYVDVLIITIVAALLALAGGILATQLFTSGVTRRLRRLERATAALEEGDLPVDPPGGSDEIGRVSQRLITAASQLRERAAERDRARRELEDILTASPVVSLRYDVDSQAFTYASPNVEKLLGISAEEVVSNPSSVVERFHPADAGRLAELLAEAARRHLALDGGRAVSSGADASMATDERVELALRFERTPGSQQWGEAEAIYTSEYSPDGRLTGVVAYLVDASERHSAQRAAEERRSMLETIFHASPDTIVVRDVRGRIILASSTLADVIGVGQRSMDRTGEIADPGAKIASVSEEDRELLDSLASRCLAGEPPPEPVITQSRFPGSGLRTFETRARAVLDPEDHVIGTVTVSRDITFRMRLEESLRETSAEAARASEAKSEFLSRMSHELRTPLNAILGFAQLLELDELSDDEASSVDQIQRAGRHLLALINEVLDISRIEAGRLTLTAEPVLVDDVLEEVATLLRPAAESNDIQLAVSADETDRLYVRADRQRLVQVLLNLGSNALKYNQRGGSVSFRISVTSNGRVRFEVRDTGPGIPLEQQSELFVPFSRLGAERSGVEGTGVGLALSKQLVELMGGSIGVESVHGHGSTFWVELLRASQVSGSDAAIEAEAVSSNGEVIPAAANSLSMVEAEKSQESPATSPVSLALPNGGKQSSEDTGGRGEVVVLQIEDNASNASLIEQVLSRRPTVRLVSSAEANLGLVLARQCRPDLIFLDLHLPDMSGEEVLYRIKASPELKDTKVVVVSADATPSRIRRMLEMGVEGYLTKPVDVEALLRLVDLELSSASTVPDR
jgi:PAS domain S-box-containing protein